MYNEFKCGCIFSFAVGRVRICASHPLNAKDGVKPDGYGGGLPMAKVKTVRTYPAFGQMPYNWRG